MKALITTVPFGAIDPTPIKIMEKAGLDFMINPHNTRLTEEQLFDLVPNFDILIAGTEQITSKVMNHANNLKMISRVGMGLDSVDLSAAKQCGIKVSFTPDAPAPAVAELTIGLMLSLLRSTHVANAELHRGEWVRHFGRRISEITIGIIGVGRIGQRVLRRLSSFGTPRILVNDLNPDDRLIPQTKLVWTDKEEIYKQADIISLHLPLTKHTKNMIRAQHIALMKPDAILINTARGGIINELDLANALNAGHLHGAAIDVFESEPYTGPLADIERCILTSHMGSMTVDCRTRMEIEATEEAVRFLRGLSLEREVPEEEYDVQKEGL